MYTMICIVESTIESVQNKNKIIFRLFATYMYIYYILVCNHYIQCIDHFNKIIKSNNYIFYVISYMIHFTAIYSIIQN